MIAAADRGWRASCTAWILIRELSDRDRAGVAAFNRERFAAAYLALPPSLRAAVLNAFRGVMKRDPDGRFNVLIAFDAPPPIPYEGPMFWKSPRCAPMTDDPKPKKPKRAQHVYTLLVEVGRSEGDDLPEDATGAALMCYASGVDENEAVNETVAVLKLANLSPLEVQGYGSLEEREAEGEEIAPEDRELMERARAENAVLVVQVTPFFD